MADPDNTFPTGFTLSVQNGTNYTRSGNTITPATNFNGALTVPTTVAKALAPFLAAALWSAVGNPSLMLWAILGSALLGTVGFVLALSGSAR